MKEKKKNADKQLWARNLKKTKQKKSFEEKGGKKASAQVTHTSQRRRACVRVHEAVVTEPDWWMTPIYLHTVGQLMALLNRKCWPH